MDRIRSLKYRIMIPTPRPSSKKKSGGGAWEALAEVASWGANAYLKYQQKKELSRKLDAMYPQIYDAMKEHTGVLVIVQYQQWKVPYPSGDNSPEILSIIIGPAASNLHSAYRRWRQGSKILQGPGKNKVLGPEACIWFTRDLSSEELKDRLNATREEKFWKPAP